MMRSENFQDMLKRPGLVVAPGVYDAIGARLVQQAGFSAVYMSGACVSASLGYPDYGLLTMTEMVDRAAAIAASVSIPLISDADTGYGNELNVTRTIREFEARGVAAVHIEDQVSPKRCGHLEGKQVVSRAEYVSKIKAAVTARRDTSFLVIARTDARNVTDLDDAIDRGNAALDAGADLIFVEAPVSIEEVECIPRRIPGPCVLNIVQGGKTPAFDLQHVEAMGYRLAIVPAFTIAPTVHVIEESLASMSGTRVVPDAPAGFSVQSLFKRFLADEWDAIRAEGHS